MGWANHPNLTTQKMLYVEISRARDRAELVTEDKAALKEQLETVSGERIAALDAVGEDKAKKLDAGTARDGGKSTEGRQHGIGRAKEAEKTPEPKTAIWGCRNELQYHQSGGLRRPVGALERGAILLSKAAGLR